MLFLANIHNQMDTVSLAIIDRRVFNRVVNTINSADRQMKFVIAIIIVKKTRTFAIGLNRDVVTYNLRAPISMTMQIALRRHIDEPWLIPTIFRPEVRAVTVRIGAVNEALDLLAQVPLLGGTEERAV